MGNKGQKGNFLILSTLSLFASFMISTGSANASLRPDIVGGVESQENEFPFMVSLHSTIRGHFCGGTLIRSNWVLTAAHCVTNPSMIQKVYVGIHDQKKLEQGEMFEPVAIISHPSYAVANPFDLDFALIKISGHSKVTPVELNVLPLLLSGEAALPMAVSAGWGLLNEGGLGGPDILNKVELPLVAQSECVAAYGADRITDRMICAGLKQGGIDTCQGDSGGPLLLAHEFGFTLIGVVSWGRGCARPDFYGVYAAVSSAISWIQEQTLAMQ